MASAGSNDARSPSVARKLNDLIATKPSPSGKPYTNVQIVQGIAEAAGPSGTTVSLSTIAQLRSGAKPNPTVNTLRALARFFRVHPSYFLDDADLEATDTDDSGANPEARPATGGEESDRAQAAQELVAAIKDNDVRGIAFRANGLSADSLRMIKTVIEQARRLEGLDGDQPE